MKPKRQVIYYHDEKNEEFSTAQITPKRIDGNYQYDDTGVGKRLSHVIWYRIIARPMAFLFLKIKYHHKIVNKDVLKQVKGQGYFLYGNHTHAIADALIPSMVGFPRDVYVIVHPNNVSMPVLGRITPSLGALPLPDDMAAVRNFTKAVKEKIRQKRCVMIYPEAHIWPYYTKIRPFADTSFRYPVQEKAPVFCLTNTYQKRRFSKTPRIVTYVDGPFFADQQKSAKEQKAMLRQQVYETMVKRSNSNTVTLIEYVKVCEETGENK